MPFKKGETPEGAMPFKKGQSGNPIGRPRKFVSLLKDMGYNKQDINTTIQNMMAMSLEELADVFKDENATVLEKTIANAIKKGIEKGSLYTLETLLVRVYGQPKQEIESKNQNINKNIQIEIINSGINIASSESDINLD
jgi:hypothetical protein